MMVLRQLCQEHPKNAAYPKFLGMASGLVGNTKEAINLFRAAIELNSKETEAWWHLALASEGEIEDSELALMLEVSKKKLNPSEEVQILFAIAETLIHRNDSTTAWHYLAKANSIKATMLPFNAVPYARALNSIQKIKNISTNAAQPLSEATENVVPIFIIGLPRSGSSYLQSLLGRFANVQCHGESMALHEALKLFENDLWTCQTLRKQYQPEILNKIRGHYLSNLKQNSGFAVDKQPYNFFYIDLILQCFPQSRILHIHREPMAACFGLFRRLFYSGQEYSYCLRRIGFFYETYRRTMDHFTEHFGDKIYHISLQDLLTKTHETENRLASFCGLSEKREAGLSLEHSFASDTMSIYQLNKKKKLSDLAVWKEYEPFLNELKCRINSMPKIPWPSK